MLIFGCLFGDFAVQLFCILKETKLIDLSFTTMKMKLTLFFSFMLCSWLGLNAQILNGTTCNDPIAIQCDGSVYTGSTAGFTNDNSTSAAYTCNTNLGTGGQIWFAWTAPTSTLVDMTTCYSTTNFDTKIHVFSGVCGALTCVAGNDDGCSSFKSLVTFEAIEGQSYLIRVGGFGSAAGTFSFSAQCYNSGDYGCTDPEALNYDPAATIFDGSCIYPVYGCTDQAAINFNASATTDDGSCTYCNAEGSVAATLYLCTFSNASQVQLDIYDAQGNLVIGLDGGTLGPITYHDVCLQAGECYTAVMSNSAGLNGWYNGYFWVNGTGGQYINMGLDDNMSSQTVMFSTDGSCSSVFGCTDPEAANFNASANTDDGSCIYPLDCTGASNATIVLTTGSFASETWFEILDADGNVVFVGSNYSSNQTTYMASACLMDGCYTVYMHDTFGDGWNGGNLTILVNGAAYGFALTQGDGDVGVLPINAEGCVPSIPVGCTNPVAENYNANAIFDDGSCIINGCTDNSATNFNPAANTDDGSCEYCQGEGSIQAQLYICTFGNGNQVELQILDDQGNEVAYYSNLSNGQVFYTSICLQPGVCYTANMINNAGPYGWSNGYFWINGTGGQYINAQPGATDALASQVFSIDGTCGTAVIYGCTDPAASNYDPAATADNGSCDYSIDCDLNSVTVTIVTQSWGTEMAWNLTDENGNVVYSGSGVASWSWSQQQICLADGCYQFNMTDSWGDGWNGGYYMISGNGFYYEGGLLYGDEASDDISVNGACSEVGGCTDAGAINFNPAATYDDGSCMYNNNDGLLGGGLIGLDMIVNLYPNPTNSGLVVNVTNLDRNADITVSVLGIDGRLMQRSQVTNGEDHKRVELNVAELAAGYYMVHVQNGSNQATMPLIKQ